MCFYEIISQAVEQNLPKDILLKFINHTKNITNEFIKKESELREIIKDNCKLNYNLASIGQESGESQNINSNNIEDNIPLNVSIISDNAEYSLKEISEILRISYKTCAKKFNELRIPRERREAKGSIYLGKTVKKHFKNQSN